MGLAEGISSVDETDYRFKRSNGRLVEILNKRTLTEFDDKGRLKKTTKSLFINGKEELSSIINYYEIDGRISVSKSFDIQGESTGYSRYKYDQSTLISTAKHFNGKNEIIFTVTSQYDESWLLVVSEISQAGENVGDYLNFYTEFDYDSNGNMIERRSSKSKGDQSSVSQFKYNALGRKITEKALGGSQLEYKYDDKGNVVERVYFPAEETFPPSIDEFSYVYDDKDSWIQRIYSNDGKPASKSIRVISYY